MLVEKDGGLSVDIKMKPGGSRDTVEWDGDSLTVKTRARAVEGKANEALVELISRAFKLPKSRVLLEKGEHSRLKRVFLAGVNGTVFNEKIRENLK